MEDALVHLLNILILMLMQVLILVLMEDALVQEAYKASNTTIVTVLILVLMEDALVRTRMLM